ncbi:MAG: hypothetical protein ACXW30_03780 [Micavibrio sp.]
MADVKLSKDEVKRLEKMENIFDYRFSIALKEHFNKAGKFNDFANAPTEAEKKNQMEALRGLLRMTDQQATLALLKSSDIFTSVARRVGNDKDLATLLPKDRLDEQDAAVLEKCQLNSLAALVRALG